MLSCYSYYTDCIGPSVFISDSYYTDFIGPSAFISDYKMGPTGNGLKRQRNEAPVNPYHALQVRHDATPSEIREAYRRLALWHHPARKRDLAQDELQRRYEVFTTLAAAYETLLENETRQLYDVFVRQEFEGEVWVGGKPWSPNKPVLQSVFSCDTVGIDEQLPDLIGSSSSESIEYDEAHPLALLRKARRGRCFSDPYDVFDEVFGSRVFERVICTPASPTLARPLRSAAWTGSTRTLKDGTLESKTSRILHDRKLTRTEIITEFPDGRKRTRVTVKAEELADEVQTTPETKGCFEENFQEAMYNWYNSFNVCGGLLPG